MRILLVNPPRSPHNGILAHAPAAAEPFIHRKLVGPPLGLLTVAAALRDHDVTFLEMKGEYDLDPGAAPPDELVTGYLERCRPQIVASTFIAPEFDLGLDVFRAAKRFDPRIVTVAGGLHATVCPEDFAGGPTDVVCPGHSPKTFAALADAMAAGRPLTEVPGLLLRGDDGLTATGPPPPVDPAGRDFLLPERSLLARWRETYVVGKSTDPATYLFTSLGCPYRCSFCSIWPQQGGGYHQREVESVVAELKALDYPVVRFADANTLVDPAFLERLFVRIEEEGIRKFLIMDLRVDAVVANPGLVERMARGGLRVVICGFESYRDEELASYNKSMKAARIGEAIRIFHENGVMIRGNYVVPPHYDRDDLTALGDYAAGHRVAYAGYTILTPMPGTPYHARVRDQIVDHDLAKYNFFNSVLPSKLPLDEFYRRVAELWIIKRGRDVI